MDDPPSFNYTKAFRWNDKFVYQNNCVGTEYRCRMGENFSSSNGTDIATDTQKLILHSPKQVHRYLYIICIDKAILLSFILSLFMLQ